jgi:phosphoglycolate phosphatase
MPPFRLFLFDHGGTLAAARAAVAACLSVTLREQGLPIPPPERLTQIIASLAGDDLWALAEAIDVGTVEQCVRSYRDHYTILDLSMTVLFEGVAETIATLRRDGSRITVLSNKGRAAVIAALDRFGLTENIDAVIAADPGEPIKPDPRTFDRRIWPLFRGLSLSDFLMVCDTTPTSPSPNLRALRVVGSATGMAIRNSADKRNRLMRSRTLATPNHRLC